MQQTYSYCNLVGHEIKSIGLSHRKEHNNSSNGWFIKQWHQLYHLWVGGYVIVNNICYGGLVTAF